MLGDQPAARTANDLFSLVDGADASQLPRLWIGCGTGDVLYDDNVRFVEHCTANGIEVTTSFTPGEHDWGLWDREIERVLAWLPVGAPG